MSASHVFISYAFVNEQHPDYLFVQQLAKDLRQEGVDVIVDTAYIEEQAFVQRLRGCVESGLRSLDKGAEQKRCVSYQVPL